ncbi:hypothetical protein TEA_001401 [Camellia sinensis var. sinensis]|uniref:Uncharacterized protein n=1 Tax=Camellia sinensis var. sinensis TaxID=542762 RepID=A0A4S4EPF8_CAMSN|nr:hypothetical protein TEA_001401 [Camellia sinensis var. sinensis]
MVELEELGPPLPPPQASSDAAPPPQPAPPPRFDPSRMIGIIRRKALIKDLAAVYHAECLAYCQELLELQRKWEETQAEHLSQTSVIPLSPEELSVKVLKPRSGYVKGLGLRPSSSMKTIVAPAKNSDYVQCLEMQIAQQNEQIARFQKSEKKQSKKIQSIIECLTQKRYHVKF